MRSIKRALALALSVLLTTAGLTLLTTQVAVAEPICLTALGWQIEGENCLKTVTTDDIFYASPYSATTVYSIQMTGGAGGAGGLDDASLGSGTRTPGGLVGSVSFTLTVPADMEVGLFAGASGQDGSDGCPAGANTIIIGGQAGSSTFNPSYDGGEGTAGANCGSSGGGGGAASVVAVNGTTVAAVAAGGAGGAGESGAAGGNGAGSNSTVANPATGVEVSVVTMGQVESSASTGQIQIRYKPLSGVSSITHSEGLTASNATTHSYNVIFNEAVSGFDASDVSVSGTSGSNGTWNITVREHTDAASYTVTVANPSAIAGTLTLVINSEGVTTASGNLSGGTKSSATLTLNFTSPSVTGSIVLAPNASITGKINAKIAFSASVANPDANKLSLSEGWVANDLVIFGTNLTFNITKTIEAQETVAVTPLAGLVTDLAGNPSLAGLGATETVSPTAITPTITPIGNYASLFTNLSTGDYNVLFPNRVWGLTIDDFTPSTFPGFCRVSAVTQNGANPNLWTVKVQMCSPTMQGSITLKLRANAVQDSAGFLSPAQVTEAPVVLYERVPPTITFTANAGESISNNISFTLAGNEAIQCSTLSATKNADFVFSNINSIVISQASSKTCNIDAVAAGVAGSAVIATLTEASAFAVSDLAGNAQPNFTRSIPNQTTVSLPTGPSFSLVRLDANGSTANFRDLQFQLESSAAQTCADLSAADFALQKMRIKNITAHPTDTTKCLINVVSLVGPGSAQTSSITHSASASALSLEVTIADPASGGIQAIPVTGTAPVKLPNSKPAKFIGVIAGEVQNALFARKITPAPVGARGVEVKSDVSHFTNTDTFALTQTQSLATGDMLTIGLKVSADLESTHDTVAYLKTGGVWYYLGRSDFETNWANSSAISLGEPGDYTFKIFVVQKSATVTMARIATRSMQSLVADSPVTVSRAALDDSTVSATSEQSLQVDVTVSGAALAIEEPAVVVESNPATPPSLPTVPVEPTPTPSPVKPSPATSVAVPIKKPVTRPQTAKPTSTPSSTPTSTPTASEAPSIIAAPAHSKVSGTDSTWLIWIGMLAVLTALGFAGKKVRSRRR